MSESVIQRYAELVEPYSGDLVAQSSELIRAAFKDFGTRIVTASSMGDEVLVHLIETVAPGSRLLFIDTSYHFSETLQLRDEISARKRIEVLTVQPLLTKKEQDQVHGKDLWFSNPDKCCAMRKVEPLERGLHDFDAWITGMRRIDAPTRAHIELVEWDKKRDKLKLNPLALWDDELYERYIRENKVELNQLRGKSYTSIGCEPCTRPTAAGEDPRAGRWSGNSKTECGLHT